MTATWVLILTLTDIRAAAVTSIPGFTTAAACTKAGDAWLAQQHFSGEIISKSALCVELK